MKGLLTKIEVLIVAVFLLIFIFWAGTKCKETKVQLQEEAIAEAVEDSLAKAKRPVEEDKGGANTLEEAFPLEQGWKYIGSTFPLGCL